MAEFKVGEVYEMRARSGNTVRRKCVGIVDAKYLDEQRKLAEENGFAPMFVKDGTVFLGMSPPTRKTVSEAEKKRREEAKRKDKETRQKAREERKERKEKARKEKYDAWIKRREEAAARKLKLAREAQEKLAKLKA